MNNLFSEGLGSTVRAAGEVSPGAARGQGSLVLEARPASVAEGPPVYSRSVRRKPGGGVAQRIGKMDAHVIVVALASSTSSSEPEPASSLPAQALLVSATLWRPGL